MNSARSSSLWFRLLLLWPMTLMAWIARRTLSLTGRGAWFVFLRPASRSRLPNGFIIYGRAALIAALCVIALFLSRFSWRHREDVFTALQYRVAYSARAFSPLEWFHRKERIRTYVKDASRKHGVQEAMIHAVIKAESNYRVGAISRTGACGLMQLQPSTHRMFSVENPFDPQVNIDTGARYLARLKRRFKGERRLMAAAYNAGPGAVARYHGVPPYPETQAYVRRVMRYYSENISAGQ